MNLVTVVAILVSALSVVLAQNDGKYRPPTTTTTRPFTTRFRPYRPYDPFNQYRNLNQGRYVARNDGRYSGASDGRYVPRNDGKYVHIEGPSGAGAGKYTHIDGPSGAGAGRYSHVDGPSGSGSGGQGSGSKAASAVPTAAPTPAYVPTTSIPVLAKQAQVRTAPPKPYDADGWKIIRLEHNVRKDGYQYIFETQNGINAEESGRIEPDGNGSEGLRSTGFYEYVGDDGQLYRVDYVADSNGFIPQGDHIPKVPPAIEKLLAYLASQPK
uniref:Putative larval cuticle protein lcp-30 n=1 Tax=Culex tarsalis TaxID=7177 RepID=A0A1Q3FNL5_CULTA